VLRLQFCDVKPEKTKAPVAMIVVAHPDDAEFGCGGSIAKWARDGWDVYLVVCTDASGGGADDAEVVGQEARRAITATRKAEQLASAKVLGIREVVFLDQPDGLLQPTIDLRRMLVRLMRTFKPDRLVCQSPERSWRPGYIVARYHPDHLAAATAAIAAMYPASQNAWDFPELLSEGLKPHKVSELYIMGAPEVNHAVDISDTLDIKVEGLRAHASQLAAHFDGVAARIREWAAVNGSRYGLAAAEVFHRAEN
jgi:LmbE family N-acetylglucosaminyl deacetylase